MKRAALHNLGCKVNAYELDIMQQNLQEKGILLYHLMKWRTFIL